MACFFLGESNSTTGVCIKLINVYVCNCMHVNMCPLFLGGLVGHTSLPKRCFEHDVFLKLGPFVLVMFQTFIAKLDIYQPSQLPVTCWVSHTLRDQLTIAGWKMGTPK